MLGGEEFHQCEVLLGGEEVHGAVAVAVSSRVIGDKTDPETCKLFKIITLKYINSVEHPG